MNKVGCQCLSWCRDFSETKGGKYPVSEHAPGCDKYQPEEFMLVKCGELGSVMESYDARAMGYDKDHQYTVTPIMLTRDQFENLTEFNGI